MFWMLVCLQNVFVPFNLASVKLHDQHEQQLRLQASMRMRAEDAARRFQALKWSNHQVRTPRVKACWQLHAMHS